MTEKNIVSFDAPDNMFARIEHRKETGGFKSRSETVRDMVRKQLELEDEEKKNRSKSVLG